MEDQEVADITLTYLIAHDDENARAHHGKLFEKIGLAGCLKASQTDGPILLKKEA